MTYHEGEQAVQRRAGVQAMAQRIGRGIHEEMPPAAQEFLHDQTMAVAGTLDSAGHVWASFLSGEPGFLSPLDEHTLRIEAALFSGDPLAANLAVNPDIGLVVISLANRQRVRLNGIAVMHPDGIEMVVQQAYSNCPQYIQARRPHAVSRGESQSQHVEILTSDQQHWIAQADTFFIASAHSESGADASHRGGSPGFVRVLNARLLEFPDYRGNTMFNTLGNITANSNTGLLFLDFERGSTLQLSGQAEIIWDEAQTARYPSAERLVRFHVEQIIETTNIIPFAFDFLGYLPSNAPVPK